MVKIRHARACSRGPHVFIHRLLFFRATGCLTGIQPIVCAAFGAALLPQCSDDQYQAKVMAHLRKRWRTEGLKLAPPSTIARDYDCSPIDFPPPIPDSRRTANDSIVYCAAPPKLPKKQTGREWESGSVDDVERFFPLASTIEIETESQAAADTKKSKGWIGSIMIHLVIGIIVALLVAPAEFGRRPTQVLTVSLSEEEMEIPAPLMLVDEIEMVDSSMQATIEDAQDIPVDIPADVDNNTIKPSVTFKGSQQRPGRSTNASSGGAMGSFFGIEAVGQEFVYIVDRSGSMNGRRFRRAVGELKRSIRELQPEQRFLVILFSDSSRMMFDGNGGQTGELVEATTENKDRFSAWLSTVRVGGGTNPNSSLRSALKINPSAIFMLSDGEFSERRKRKKGLLDSGGTAQSIVEASGKQVPVHAIAFEDPRSCENMKQLAEVSGGEYRFVNWMGQTESQLVADLKRVTSRPMNQWREKEQKELCHAVGSHQVSLKSKREVAEMLISEHEFLRADWDLKRRGVTKPVLNQTIVVLESLLAIDPFRDCCGAEQDQIANELSDLLDQIGPGDEKQAACDRMLNLYTSEATTQVLDRMIGHYQSLPADTKSFGRLKLAKQRHTHSKVADLFEQRVNLMVKTLIGDSQRQLEQGNVVGAIKTLRETLTHQQDRAIHSAIFIRLRDLTMKQLIEARDAAVANQRSRKLEIDRQLDEAFGSDPALQQFKSTLVKQEMAARKMLQTANEINPHIGMPMKQSHLKLIVRQFPLTLAARQAREQLGDLPDLQRQLSQEEAEVTRMMDDARRK